MFLHRVRETRKDTFLYYSFIAFVIGLVIVGVAVSYGEACASSAGSGSASKTMAEERITANDTIPGSIDEDTTITAGEYDLPIEVIIKDDATLTIEPGAILNGGRIYVQHNTSSSGTPGNMIIDGAVLRGTRIDFVWPGSDISGSTLESSSHLYISTDYSISGNTFRDSRIQVVPEFDLLPRVFINGNTFYTSTVNIGLGDYPQPGSSTEVTIGSNTGNINLSALGKSKLTIEDNDFTAWTGLQLGVSDELIVRRNTFIDTGDQNCVTVSGTGPFTILSNRFESDRMWDSSNYSNASAISINGATYSGVVRDNTITGQPIGIKVIGDVSAEISKNQLTKNRDAMVVEGNGCPVIGNNCFAINGPKAGYNNGAALRYSSRTNTLHVESNYWGHPSGPVHPENSDGIGDLIRDDSSLVDFLPFLDSCNVDAKDLWPAGMEAVQVIQTLQNEVPLVAGKPTIVRVYAYNSPMGAVPGVTGRLTAFRNGEPLKPVLFSQSPAIAVSPGTDWDVMRSTTDHSLDFKIPSTWLKGTIKIMVEINPGPSHAIEEIDYSNNKINKTLAFHAQTTPRIAVVPIHYARKFMFPPSPARIDAFCREIKNMFPVSDVNCAPQPALRIADVLDYSPVGISNIESICNLVTQVYVALNKNLPDASMYDRVIAVVPYLTELERVACTNTCGGFTVDDKSDLLYVYGISVLKQIGLDSFKWPYTDNTIQQYGYNARLTDVVPRTHTDVFICDKTIADMWISPWSYSILFLPLGASAQHQSVGAADATKYLTVSGWADRYGDAALFPSWQVSSSTAMASNPSAEGEYCIELRDGASLVYRHCFDLTFTKPLYPESYQYITHEGFSFVLPLADGVDGVILRKGSTVLDQIDASAHAPQLIAGPVQTIAPAGDESAMSKVAVNWAATDADGGELLFTALMSDDNGATWRPLLVNSANTSILIDLAQVPSGGTALVQVIATDGFNTSHIDIGPFATSDIGPWVVITEPEHLSKVTFPLNLTGSAYDIEDEAHIESGYVWRSDRDGKLGNGRDVTIASLSAGKHTITLSAADGDGHTNSASVVVSTMDLVDAPIAGLAAHNDGPTNQGELTRLYATMTTGDNCSFEWDFGDGTTGYGNPVDHLFAGVGEYHAAVTAQNRTGNANATTDVKIRKSTAPPAGVSVYLPTIQGQ